MSPTLNKCVHSQQNTNNAHKTTTTLSYKLSSYNFANRLT